MIEFQSAHPVRGATFFGFRILPAPLFQSTRPVWGATASHLTRRSSRRISIHAPRVGRDRLRAQKNLCCGHFNPRAPCGARPHECRIRYQKRKFQSTRPVWGATFIASLSPDFLAISIHAPRVGRDYGQAYLTRYAAIFQSTRPVWGATPKPADAVFCPVISIHAPRVGRDYTGADGRSRACHFNPRAPCGARPKYVKTTTWLKRFQSTRPVWGATLTRKMLKAMGIISIHAPRVGRDYIKP